MRLEIYAISLVMNIVHGNCKVPVPPHKNKNMGKSNIQIKDNYHTFFMIKTT